MEHDERAVCRQVHVHLHAVAVLHGGAERFQRIFRHGLILPVQPAVGIVAVDKRRLLRARRTSRRDEIRHRARGCERRSRRFQQGFHFHQKRLLFCFY